jgi:hypothetical protein
MTSEDRQSYVTALLGCIVLACVIIMALNPRFELLSMVIISISSFSYFGWMVRIEKNMGDCHG